VLAASIAGLAIYIVSPSGLQLKAQQLNAQQLDAAESAQAAAQSAQLPAEPPECTFFGAGRDRFTPRPNGRNGFEAGRLTRQFQAAVLNAGAANPAHTGRAQSFTTAQTGKANIIDQNIWAICLPTT